MYPPVIPAYSDMDSVEQRDARERLRDAAVVRRDGGKDCRPAGALYNGRRRLPTKVYLLPPVRRPYTSVMEHWVAVIFFLLVITCVCMVVHWQSKRKRTKE
jgi:hypothetical protein